MVHRLARVPLHVVSIDVDGVSWRDLAACDETPPQGGLARQGGLDGDGVEETVRWRGRREQGEASEEAAGGAADRLDRPETGGGAAERLADEAQGEARLRQTVGRGRSQRGGEVVGASWEKRGKKTAPASARRGQPAWAQSGDIMREVVAGDETCARLAGPIEAVHRFFGEEPCRERWGCPRFCLDRPTPFARRQK